MPRAVTTERPAAPGRGRRRLDWREASFVSLDFETTGLDPHVDVVVSFGVVPVRGGRVTMRDSVHQLIDPAVPPSPRSQTVHELRPSDLAGSPRIEEASERLKQALQKSYLLVWFAEVELTFLRLMFGGTRRTWRRRTIDVRNLAIAVDSAPRGTRDRPGYALTATAERFGVPVANPHDALDDALVTAQLFLVLATKLGGRTPPTVGRLLRIGRP